MKLIFPILFLSFSFFSQTKYIGEFSENDVTFVYDFNLYQHGNYIFVRDQNDKKVYSLNELTGTFSSIYNCVQNESILQYFDSKNGFCFVTRTYNSNGELRKIYLINEYGEINNLDQFQSSSSEYLTIFFVGDTMYEQTGSQGNFNLYKIVNGIKTLESTSNSVIWYLFEKNNKVFYYTAIDNIDYLCVKDGSTITNLGRVNSSGAYPFKKSETNDTNNLYLYTAETGGEWSLKKFNLETSTLTNFFSENIKNLYFENDSIFYDNNKRYRIQGDTAVFEKSFEVKNELRSFQIISSNESSYYQYLEAPTKTTLYYSNQNGMEIVGKNSDDSLDIISNNALGRSSGIGFSYCSNSLSEFYPKYFTHNNKLFFLLPNTFDNKYYVYELKNDSLISIFSLGELDVYSLEFYPKEESLYFSTYNSDSRIVKLYKRDWSLPNELAPSTKPNALSKTWYTEIGIDNLNYSCYLNGNNMVINDVYLDSEMNTYASFIDRKSSTIYYNSVFYDIKNDSIIPTEYPHSIVKYDQYGHLIWFNNIGDKYKFWSNYDKFLINKKGNPVIIGNYYKKGKFDEDSLTSFGSAIYFAELDKISGKVLQKRKIQESAFVDDFNIFDTQIDKSGNIYISFYYRNYSVSIGDTTLLSDWNLQNALIKIDENGNLIWAKNIVISIDDYLGASSNIEYDSLTDLVTLVYYQQGYIGCEEYFWQAEIIQIDATGKLVLQDKIIEGNHNSELTKIQALGNNHFLIKSAYYGQINAEIFTNTTAPKGNCFQKENFELVYDVNQQRITQAITTENNEYIIPIDVETYNDTIYILGTNKDSQLKLQIYNLSSEFLGEKAIAEVRGSSQVHFDVKDNYIVLFGDDIIYNPTYEIMPILDNIYSVSLLKIEKGEWEKPKFKAKSMDIYSLVQNQGEISVFPNPVEDFCEVNFNNIDFSPTEFILTDLSGRVILREQLKDQPFVRLNLTGQASGMYIFNLIGDVKKYNIKLVKI
jgi:hypothetical protein